MMKVITDNRFVYFYFILTSALTALGVSLNSYFPYANDPFSAVYSLTIYSGMLLNVFVVSGSIAGIVSRARALIIGTLIVMFSVIWLYFPGIYSYDTFAAFETIDFGRVADWFGYFYHHLFKNLTLREGNAGLYFIFQILLVLKLTLRVFEISPAQFRNSMKVLAMSMFVTSCGLMLTLSRDAVAGLAAGLVFLELLRIIETQSAPRADFYFDVLLFSLIRQDSTAVCLVLSIVLFLIRPTRRLAFIFLAISVANFFSMKNSYLNYRVFNESVVLAEGYISSPERIDLFDGMEACFDSKKFIESKKRAFYAPKYRIPCGEGEYYAWSWKLRFKVIKDLPLFLRARGKTYLISWGLWKEWPGYHWIDSDLSSDSEVAKKFPSYFTEQKQARWVSSSAEPYRIEIYKILLAISRGQPLLILLGFALILRTQRRMWNSYERNGMLIFLAMLLPREFLIFAGQPHALYNYHTSTVLLCAILFMKWRGLTSPQDSTDHTLQGSHPL